MDAAITLRAERPGDEEAIAALTRAAFAAHPHSDHAEQLIVAALRESGALALSLVAERHGRVVGHVAFSPVTIGGRPSDWYGLGPMAVAPPQQRAGIGRALVETGLAALRERGAGGCVVLGEPAFYGRFGFVHHPGLVLAGVPPEYFLALAFAGKVPCGRLAYHAAFDAH